MRPFLLLLLTAITGLPALAQYNPNTPPNTFRTEANPHYWKNKMPFEGYWQQDVYYRIQANINEKTDVIEGQEQLTYWNNSPDTLEFVFFHLYQEAFQPGSYYDALHEGNKLKPTYGKYEERGQGTEITKMRANNVDLITEQDNTIMKVWLNKALAPGDSVTFDIGFNTYYDMGGSIRRRMKMFMTWGYKHYNGAHWYPRISVYDRKFGWTTDQHLGREFYGDFGTYEVELTFANNYVVGATGQLQNESEVLPTELREALDISNFADKKWNSKPSVVIEYDSTIRKIWKFYAENIHDFAFTASPIYRIGEVTENGITAQALVQEPHAARWQNAAKYTMQIVNTFSRDFGQYAYPKMIVSDAADGMEYNMLTMDGGSDPGYRDLFVHEVGHNWFYGMVANNETYRAAMDEGFTQFLTAWGLQAIDGKYVHYKESKNWYVKMFSDSIEARDDEVYIGYLWDAVRDEDMPLNTHSDQFNGAIRHGGGYRHVYYKMGTLLFNLQYVLGDSLFLDAMQHYFDQWSFAHPYPEDFRQSIINYTDVDLNWFFDQWLETTKSIDYKVKKVVRGDEDGQYFITFKRKGEMQMPIDFTVVLETGERIDYHIPNQWFVKETEATIVPKWTGWQKLNQEYTCEVNVAGKIENVVIDPSNRLADIYMPDNKWKSKPDVKFDAKVKDHLNWKQYQVYMRPDIWYNSYDGIKIGFHTNGHYMKYKNKLHMTLWYNTGLLQGGFDEFAAEEEKLHDRVSFNIEYETGINKLIPKTNFFVTLRHLDGLNQVYTGLEKELCKNLSATLAYNGFWRANESDLNYLLYPGLWSGNQFNGAFNVSTDYDYSYSAGSGNVNLFLYSTAFSNYNDNSLTLTYINEHNMGKLKFRSRVFGQWAMGTNGALESDLYFAGASPDEMMGNKYVRSKGFFPSDWVGQYGPTTNHFHFGGGMNMRGYAGYYLVEVDNYGEAVQAYHAGTGVSLNGELEFDRLIPFKPKKLSKYLDLDTYLFGDVGTIRYYNSANEQEWSAIRADAGVGAALTIKRFGPIQEVKPLTIRFDMPLLLTRPPAAEPDYFQFRWIVGVQRAF